ncbi:hypothetical protein GGR51DRAFT_503581 [Nemania sp. FL0031]|nr:hypothetical protein GGR51DRAFT_503581 [Nemania sp. FL0031]
MNTSTKDIQTKIDFIADLPLYAVEKPFFLHASAYVNLDLDKIQTSNVQWDPREVTVYSMRDKANLSLESNGFCYVKHESIYAQKLGLGADMVKNYRTETEEFLKGLYKAEFVHGYDYKMRKNAPMTLQKYDPQDPLLVEAAAVGAHVDISLDTVPELVKSVLNEEDQQRFFQPGYRFRLINTWRSILPECEDRPLALCDYSSINANDLVPTERVYPTRIQEIYHLKYNKKQQWYWLPNQLSSEPFLFLTYDSHSGSNARYCPHISVDNPLARPEAPPRLSVETRNLVITRV